MSILCAADTAQKACKKLCFLHALHIVPFNFLKKKLVKSGDCTGKLPFISTTCYIIAA